MANLQRLADAAELPAEATTAKFWKLLRLGYSRVALRCVGDDGLHPVKLWGRDLGHEGDDGLHEGIDVAIVAGPSAFQAGASFVDLGSLHTLAHWSSTN
eukprot:4652908-Heterocapsa_arctica.AAC.1